MRDRWKMIRDKLFVADVAGVKSRSVLRWLSHHPGLRLWLLGTTRWSVIVIRDDGRPSRQSATQAFIEVQAEEVDKRTTSSYS